MPSVAHAYRGVLTGGLSNQLMHLAEALERACSADAYLVLPRFNAGWFNHVDEATGHAFADAVSRSNLLDPRDRCILPMIERPR